MVSESGQVKLLDFGIAKLIDPHALSPRITHATPFTPDHAAPEQIEGGPVFYTHLDVYKRQGERHHGYGVLALEYDKVGDALLRTLALHLGEAFDQTARTAWGKVYALSLIHI